MATTNGHGKPEQLAGSDDESVERR